MLVSFAYWRSRRRAGNPHEQTDRLTGNLLSRDNAIYWIDFTYQARLPNPGPDADANAAIF